MKTLVVLLLVVMGIAHADNPRKYVRIAVIKEIQVYIGVRGNRHVELIDPALLSRDSAIVPIKIMDGRFIPVKVRVEEIACMALDTNLDGKRDSTISCTYNGQKKGDTITLEGTISRKGMVSELRMGIKTM